MIDAGYKSDAGRRREQNEDAFMVSPFQHVYVVADGVGGNNSGEYASRMAVSCVADYIRENPFSAAEDETDLYNMIYRCIKEANRIIYTTANELKESKGMATTLVLCFISKGKAYFANVGDSRAYIKRKEKTEQITEDHSYVNTLLRMGVISREEAKNHVRGNVITRALGAEENVQPDFYSRELEDGDVIILCTDGLHNEVSEEQMSNIIENSTSMSLLADSLVEAANKAGGKDNITVVCLKIRREAADEQ